MGQTEKKQWARFWNKHGWALILLGLFLLFLAMNHFTVSTQDDYKYTLFVGESPAEIFVHSLNFAFGEHYQNWGGRAIAHFFAVLFLSLPRWVFHWCNAGVSVLLVVLLTRFVYPGGKCIPALRQGAFMLLAVFLMLWFCMPDFPGTMLWVTGASNYLWGGVIILSFCLPYRRLLAREQRKHPVPAAVLMALWGVAAGWCNENTSGGGLLFALACTAVVLYRRKKAPIWTYTGMAGAVFGLVMMVTAPGNRVRAQLEHDLHGKSFLMQLLRTLMRLPEHALLLILLIGLVVYLWPKHKKDGTMLLPGLLALCGLAMNFAMAFSPTFPSRAGFGMACMLIAANGLLLSMVSVPEPNLRRTISVVTALVLLCVVWQTLLFMGEASVITKVYRKNEVKAAQWQQSEPLPLNYVEALSPKSTFYGQYQPQDHYYKEYLEAKYDITIQWQGPLYDNWTTVAKMFLKG